MTGRGLDHYIEEGFPILVMLTLFAIGFSFVAGLRMKSSGASFTAAAIDVVVGVTALVMGICILIAIVLGISAVLGYIATDLRHDISQWWQS